MTILLFLGLSCLEEIDLDVPKGIETTIAIQGKLIQGHPSHVTASISRLFDFTSLSLQPIAVRDVILWDDQQNSVKLMAVDLGLYETEIWPDNNLKIEVGQTYLLEVFTLDGRQFRSAWEPLMPVPKASGITLDSFQQDIVDNNGNFRLEKYYRFSLDSDLKALGSEENSFFLWEIERTFQITDSPLNPNSPSKTCYITETLDLSDIKVLNGRQLNGTLTRFPVYETDISFHFNEGYYLTVYQHALSRDAYNYFNQLKQSVARTGNMFEAPAGKISTNFSNVNDDTDEVFGYFYAAQQDTIRLYVSPELSGGPRHFCPPDVPPPPGGGCPLVVCCDCLSTGRSTIEKPSFWIQ